MIRRNDLKDILHRASLDASKPAADEVWAEVLAGLDEQMPVKRKKRRFLFVFFLLGGLALFPGIWTVTRYANTPANKGNDIQQTVVNDRHAHAGITNDKTLPDNTAETKTLGGTGKSLHEKSGSFQAPHLPIPDVLPYKAGLYPYHNMHKDIIINERMTVMHKTDIPFEPFIEGLYLYDDFGRKGFAGLTAEEGKTLDSLQEKHKDTSEKKDIPDKPVYKRNLAFGGTINYAFNNFTTRENRSSSQILNGMYQVYKQLGVNLYCRIPVTRLYQLQPEIGIEPYSTDIQINYRTPGESIFTRYNLKRMVYSQVGLSNYFEIKHNLYLSGGAYFSYALPVYGAQLDRVSQEPNKTEQVLSSAYEHKDFRSNVFGLRRSDYGVTAGIEYHFRHMTGSLRVCRGLTDVTPETPTMYHNFGLSVRLGYHFELRRKPHR